MSSMAGTLQLQVSTSYRHILKLALPIAASMIVPQLNFITNNIFIGRFLPPEYLGIAAITGVYYLIFSCIGLGLNNGLQALIARRAGENRVAAIGSLFQNAVLISFIISAVNIIITYTIAPVVLHYVLHSPNHAQKALSFLYIRMWGLPFLYLYQMRNALLVGTNNSRFLVIGTLAETITNIFFDYSLITGAFIFPKMGFDGAALASVIAEFAGLLVIYALMNKRGISRQLHMFSGMHINLQDAKLIFTQSAPLVLQFAISLTSWEFFYILIERNHSITDLAISNSMRNVFGLFGCFGWSFAAASNAMVSNVIGQGRQEEVLPLIRRIVRLGVLLALSVCLLLNVIPHLFFSIYGQSESFIEGAIPVMHVVSAALVMQPVAAVWLNAVVGTGNSRINLYTETLTIIVYSLYVWLVMEKLHLSIVIGWMSEWLYWIVLFIPSFLYMHSGRWKNKRI
jgi:MATE family multidrug resistance protein